MTYLFQVTIQTILEANKPLILALVLILKINGYFILLIFKPFDQVTKALIKVLNLLTEQLMQLFSRLFK